MIYIGLNVKYPLFLPDFKETWIISTDFHKILNYKISWKSSSGNVVFPCGAMTVRRDDANSRFSQFCERI